MKTGGPELGGEAINLADSKGLRGKAAQLAAHIPANTERVYRGQIARYDAWCRHNGLHPWDASVVADYLAAMHEHKRVGAVSLRQAATAIRRAFAATGRETNHPEWEAVIKGAVTEMVKAGVVGRGEAYPLDFDTLKVGVRALYRFATETGIVYETAWAARDRALLLIGYLGALRRSELTALDLDDVEIDTFKRPDGTEHRGLVVRIRGAKTTRDHLTFATIPQGYDAATDPVRAWEDWRKVRRDEGESAWLANGRTGRLITVRLGGDHSIARIIRRALNLGGIFPPLSGRCAYTAHSLRAGLATELAEKGVHIAQIANAGRWTGLDTALRYASRARRWEDSPHRALTY